MRDDFALVPVEVPPLPVRRGICQRLRRTGLEHHCIRRQACEGDTAFAGEHALSSSEVDCLFNWGEDHYSVLTPVRPTTLTAPPYRYRYYASTGVYLGVSSADDHLYSRCVRSGEFGVGWQLVDSGEMSLMSFKVGARLLLPEHRQGNSTQGRWAIYVPQPSKGQCRGAIGSTEYRNRLAASSSGKF